MSLGRRERWSLMGQQGCVIWLTGLSASGKSTIASALDQKLYELGLKSFVLDGDNLRLGLSSDLGFSDDARTENVRRAGEVARLMADAGLIVVCAFISPFARQRAQIRANCEAAEIRFIEVYVNAPLQVCETRDPKGLYRKARTGQIQGFTGIDARYEPPQKPEIELCTDRSEIGTCVESLLAIVCGA